KRHHASTSFIDIIHTQDRNGIGRGCLLLSPAPIRRNTTSRQPPLFVAKARSIPLKTRE
ncbi:MAG: hypothetical protein ACI9AF_001918, partial [Granulosicoccus sp.]